jgi:hypothetical protein
MPYLIAKGARRPNRGRFPAAALLSLLLLPAGLAACGSSGSSTSTIRLPAAAADGASATGPAAGASTSSTRTSAPGSTAGASTPSAGATASAAAGAPARPSTSATPSTSTAAPGAGRVGASSSAQASRVLRSSRFHEALVRFAACLRQNGIDVGEPNTSGKGPLLDTKGLSTGSPRFKTAAAKCRAVLFEGLQSKAGAAGAHPKG